jgi:predicted ribosomally synthesized peptide with nif11-like leader
MVANWRHSHRTTQAMSEEQLRAFQEAVKADPILQEKLKAASDADDVAAIAKAAGFIISAKDVDNAQAELSDEEMEGVAGGAPVLNCNSISITQRCL